MLRALKSIGQWEHQYQCQSSQVNEIDQYILAITNLQIANEILSSLEVSRLHTEPEVNLWKKQSPYFIERHHKDNQENMRTRSQTSHNQNQLPCDDTIGNDRFSGSYNPPLSPPTTPINAKSKKRKSRTTLDEIIEEDRPPTPESLPSKKLRSGNKKKEVVVEIPSEIQVQIDTSKEGCKQIKTKKSRNPKDSDYDDDDYTNGKKESQSKSKSRSKSKKNTKVSVVINGNQDKDEKGTKAAEEIITKSESGIIENIGKIHLIQEKLRFNPWKMLIATSLLNKTSGRAARPILKILLERYPTPKALSEASIPDLAELLYPLGLFNQRASSLVRFSRQYLDLNWPLYQITNEALYTEDVPSLPLPLPNSDLSIQLQSIDKTDEDEEIKEAEEQNINVKKPSKQRKKKVILTYPEDPLKDVKVFHGSGTYASDSFRIYSNLLPGKGAPNQESKWLDKFERSKSRIRENGLNWNGSIDQISDHMSDEGDETDEEKEEEEEEEWRKVIPLDKELRRYLIWRWGIEGITYDIHAGPKIAKERDKKRLQYLLTKQP